MKLMLPVLEAGKFRACSLLLGQAPSKVKLGSLIKSVLGWSGEQVN